jgi:ribose-phosphate pyrophosphokinase
MESLRESGAAEVISCNTIPHPTNAIDVGGPIAAAVTRLLGAGAPTAPPRALTI